MSSLLKEQLITYLLTMGFALLGAISMGIGLGVALKIFTMLTPNLDEMEELKKGNMAVGMVLTAVVLSMGVVISITLVS